jgi:hypothetical protein
LKTAGATADEHVIRTPFDDDDVDLRQRQLSRQHHPRRTASGDHHRMLSLAHFAAPSHRFWLAARDYEALLYAS